MTTTKVLTLDGLEYYTTKVDAQLEKKVDKINGKSLSTNDFTNGYKEAVDTLIETGAQPNIIESVKVNGTALGVTDKAVNIDLTPYAKDSDMETALDGKVDKVSGKGLSTNDYTTTEKSKLSGIKEGAQVNVLEGVQVNGSDLSISNKKVNVDLTPYAKNSDMQTALGKKVDKADGYSLMSDAEKSKLSKLNADAEGTYATKSDVSTGLSGKVDKVSGSRLMTTAEGTKLSKLADDPNSTYATKQELSSIPKLGKTVVNSLPTTNIDTNTIYLVPNAGSGTNSRDEYLYIDGKWELIGTTQVDISGKADISYVDDEIDAVNDKIDNLDIPTYDIEIVDELPSSVVATDVIYLKPSNKADKSYVDEELRKVNDVINSLDIPEGVIVDSVLDGSSVNAIQNKVVTLEFGKKANASDVYTKGEIDEKVTTINNAIGEVNGAVALKINASDVYTKSEMDTKLGLKANSSDVYTKSEMDTKLNIKMNVSDLEAITTTEINAMF